MLLNDTEIEFSCTRGTLITPFEKSRLQPASYDVRLLPNLLVYNGKVEPLDLRTGVPGTYLKEFVMGKEGYILQPNEFVLGSTIEEVNVPNFLAVRFEGKSTLGRIGLTTHVTAGFVDPGFSGRITLEIKNLAPWPIVLYPKMDIGQLSFSAIGHIEEKDGSTEKNMHVFEAAVPYGSGRGSHYVVQEGPVAAVGMRGEPL